MTTDSAKKAGKPAPKADKSEKLPPKGLVTSSFPKFVQIGRVCLLKAGKQAGKIVSIVDVIDGKRVSKSLFT
jgi:hypothetical protein